MDKTWKPRDPASPLPPEALHRAACRLLSLAIKDRSVAEHRLTTNLGEWGNPAEVMLRCQPGELTTHGNRAVLVYRLDGTAAGADQARLFSGRALIDHQTYAVLELSLKVAQAVRRAR